MGKALAFERRFNEVEKRFIKDPNNPRIKMELDAIWDEYHSYRKNI